MSGQSSQMETLRVLRDHLDRGPIDDQQVGIICKLLSAVDLTQIDASTDCLSLIRMYLKNNQFPHTEILNQFAAGGFFNIQGEHLRTPLHWFIISPQLRMAVSYHGLKSIINHGGNPAIADIDGNNAVHMVLSHSLNTMMMRAVLEGQPKPSPLVTARNKKGWTPLRILASQDEFAEAKTLKLLHDFGADITEVDEMGNSLLHIAFRNQNQSNVQYNYRKIAKTFVKLGADVNIKNSSNHVPLRLAIDSKIPLNYVVPLIPSAYILNDDSCWDGQFIDYVIKNSIQKYGDKFYKAAFEAGANHVSEDTLLMAVKCEDVPPEFVELMLNQGCRVNRDIINETFNRDRFDLMEMILTNADEEMISVTKVSPNILVKISGTCIEKSYKAREYNVPLKNLIVLCVNKFDIDVNYKDTPEDDEESTLLHNLVELAMFNDDDTSSLKLILNFDGLDINAIAKKDTYYRTTRMNMSALDFSVHIESYKAAELLIQNFADISQLQPFKPRKYNGFALCFQLLSVLGHKFDFDKLKESVDDEVKREVEYVENWISERSKKVLTLKELSALQVRRAASRRDIQQLVDDVEIPGDILDILFLKYLKSDFLAIS